MSEKGSRVGYWIAIAVLGLLLFGSVLTNLFGFFLAVYAGSGSGAVAGYDYPAEQEPLFEEVWSHGYGKTRVARIALEGVIMRGRQERLIGYEPDMVASVLSQIRAATIDDSIQAIILEVDSPGGAVTPSDEIYTALKRFKAAGNDRVIMVFVRDLGASGAYYAAMAGDFIMAEPTAIVGSVGVIMQTFNMKRLSDMIGVSSVTIASGENKDMLNPFEAVDPEHLRLLQGLVDSMQERFSSIVMEARGLDSDELLDGRVFTSDQAMDAKLIDGVGYWDDAVAQLADMLGEDDLFIIRYSEPAGFWDSLFSAETAKVPNLESINSPKLMYLWKP